jgi:type I restriction enzyme M protein
MDSSRLKSSLERIWLEFHAGGITNPLTVIEQISYLLFVRLLDIRENTAERKWDLQHRGDPDLLEIAVDVLDRNPFQPQKDLDDDVLKELVETIEQHGVLQPLVVRPMGERRYQLIDGEGRWLAAMKAGIDVVPCNVLEPFVSDLYSPDQQSLRWSRFRQLGAEEMMQVVRDEVFPHIQSMGGQGEGFSDYMADAQFMIQNPTMLSKVVGMINNLPLAEGDVKGDLYEQLLSRLTTAGIAGQFRTPRHIIQMMCRLALHNRKENARTWSVCDPACGTGGFLVGFLNEYSRLFTSPEERGKTETGEFASYSGDQLSPEQVDRLQSGMLHGFDFDITMLRIGTMNLMLHGIDTPAMHYQNTLSHSFPEQHPRLAEKAFDLVLANPPFKGALDFEEVHPSLLGKVKTKNTALLFLVQMLKMLKPGGRCAVIVPDGVLFGSSKAHQGVRQMLVDDNQLEAVISLPSGVFKPYAGVSTAVLVFTREGTTGDVFFYDVEADGFSLDDKRLDREENDLPDVQTRWAEWEADDTHANFGDRKAKSFAVPADEIRENNFDLTINRYKEIVYAEIEYDPPQVILDRLEELEAEMAADLKELRGMLS